MDTWHHREEHPNNHDDKSSADRCPTDQQLQDFAAFKLSTDDILGISRHITACERCGRLVTALMEPALIAELEEMRFRRLTKRCPPERLLRFYIEGKVSWLARLRLGRHIRRCSICRDVAESFRDEINPAAGGNV